MKIDTFIDKPFCYRVAERKESLKVAVEMKTPLPLSVQKESKRHQSILTCVAVLKAREKSVISQQWQPVEIGC